MVPLSIRIWFVIHFFFDLIFAIPLLLFPSQTLAFFGIFGDAILARIIGAALIGIGGASLIERNATKETFHALLNLKLLWSGTASIAILIGAITTGLWSLWIFFFIFFGFFLLWAFFKNKLS